MADSLDHWLMGTTLRPSALSQPNHVCGSRAFVYRRHWADCAKRQSSASRVRSNLSHLAITEAASPQSSERVSLELAVRPVPSFILKFAIALVVRKQGSGPDKSEISLFHTRRRNKSVP